MSEHQLQIRAREIRPGDFLDEIEGKSVRGPRGGRYRLRGVKVQSRVVRCGWVDEFEHARGFRIVPTTGAAFILPGNSADLVDATVRREIEASVAEWQTDDELLDALDSPVRAVNLAAAAELERRTAA